MLFLRLIQNLTSLFPFDFDGVVPLVHDLVGALIEPLLPLNLLVILVDECPEPCRHKSNKKSHLHHSQFGPYGIQKLTVDLFLLLEHLVLAELIVGYYELFPLREFGDALRLY